MDVTNLLNLSGLGPWMSPNLIKGKGLGGDLRTPQAGGSSKLPQAGGRSSSLLGGGARRGRDGDGAEPVAAAAGRFMALATGAATSGAAASGTLATDGTTLCAATGTA